MGAKEKLKRVFDDKRVNQRLLAEELGISYGTFRNKLTRDVYLYRSVEEILDTLGVDIIFRDRETGKLYE